MSHENEQFLFNTEISTIINSKSPISFVNEPTKFNKKKIILYGKYYYHYYSLYASFNL